MEGNVEGSLSDILPHPIDRETERILQEHMKRKMAGAAWLSVRLLRAMEGRFGPEVRDVVRQMALDINVTPRPDPGQSEADLRQFCADLDRACAGSHRWERVIDEPRRVGYNYTRCMWAEVFRELGEPELGFVICAGDAPAIRAYNPKLGFERTQVLMNGDPICDHLFFVDDGIEQAGEDRYAD